MKDVTVEEYTTLLTPDLFAEIFGYPRALVRLAIDRGLKTRGGKITGIAFCRWFTAHYNDIRDGAGLPRLDTPVKGMTSEERANLTMGNVIRTLADYSASRASSLEHKREWTKISNQVASCSI